MDPDAATPAPNLIHEPPSLPNSPHPKRTKTTELPTAESNLIGTASTYLAASRRALTDHNLSESRGATPTPVAMASHSLQHVAHLPPIQSLATTDAPPQLQVQLLTSKGRVPTRGSAFAAGYDLYSSEDTTVPARGKAMVSTDISIAVPPGTCMFVPSDAVHCDHLSIESFSNIGSGRWPCRSKVRSRRQA